MAGPRGSPRTPSSTGSLPTRASARRAPRPAVGGRRPHRPAARRPPRRSAQHRGADEELAGAVHPARRSAAEAFARLPAAATTPARDYVFCSRLGRRLDGAARPPALQARTRRDRPSAPALPRAAPRRRHARRATRRRPLGPGLPRPLEAHDDRALPAREGPSRGRRPSEPRLCFHGSGCYRGSRSAHRRPSHRTVGKGRLAWFVHTRLISRSWRHLVGLSTKDIVLLAGKQHHFRQSIADVGRRILQYAGCLLDVQGPEQRHDSPVQIREVREAPRACGLCDHDGRPQGDDRPCDLSNSI